MERYGLLPRLFSAAFANLRVPFSGNVLTPLLFVILISVSYKWREHGLYWRAGLICALMKAMSPSAVIFGPMIAIIAESLLLEASVRLFGKTFIGFIVGSMLAMSWNLFQKILNMVIFYGGKLDDLYSSLTDYAARELHLKFDTFWAPLILLLVIYSFFGAANGCNWYYNRPQACFPSSGKTQPVASVIKSSPKAGVAFLHGHSHGWQQMYY
jgi:hypothetical protein